MYIYNWSTVIYRSFIISSIIIILGPVYIELEVLDLTVVTLYVVIAII